MYPKKLCINTRNLYGSPNDSGGRYPDGTEIFRVGHPYPAVTDDKQYYIYSAYFCLKEHLELCLPNLDIANLENILSIPDTIVNLLNTDGLLSIPRDHAPWEDDKAKWLFELSEDTIIGTPTAVQLFNIEQEGSSRLRMLFNYIWN